MKRLQDKVVVVMGAGQTPGETIGNGRAAAIAYAREGAKVLAVDRDLDSAEETAAAIRMEGQPAMAIRADVTKEAEIITVMRTAVEEWGTIDVLHNNVGVSHRAGDAVVTEIEEDVFSLMHAINVGGMTLAAKHAIPVMQAAGGGTIINIASIAALIDYPGIGYKTTKTAVVALTENIAMRHAPDGIRANAVLPGMMDTPMAVDRQVDLGANRDEVVAKRTADTPLGIRGTAWDVANAAVFLASTEASFITGASLVVDGGQSLKVG